MSTTTAISTTISADKLSKGSKTAALVLIVLGFFAILLPLVAGLSITIFIGSVMLIGGFFLAVSSFTGQWTGTFLWKLLIGVMYIVGGLSLIAHPAVGLFTFTLLLAGIFFVEGVVELMSFAPLRGQPGSGLILINGIVTLVLSVMLWRGWPSSAVWALGTLIGLNLITTGLTRLSYRHPDEFAAQLFFVQLVKLAS